MNKTIKKNDYTSPVVEVQEFKGAHLLLTFSEISAETPDLNWEEWNED